MGILLVVQDIASARRPILRLFLELGVELDDKLLVLAPGGTGSPFCALELLDRFVERDADAGILLSMINDYSSASSARNPA